MRPLAIGAVAGVAGVAAYLLLRRDDAQPVRLLLLRPVAAREETTEAAQKRNAGELRNAQRRSWRRPSVGDSYEWAPWLPPLQGQTGVYLIRDRRTRELLYIGECHRPSQGLLRTLRRHMWSWTGPTAGPTYRPQDVEVAFELTSDGEEAKRRQYELIQRLLPRDNVQDGSSLAPVPF
jgi:hypothetical protein